MRYIIHRRQRSEEDDEELAESIEKLKKELRQSADTIIKRLGTHVTKLEGLLREADQRCTQLETRVADAQRIEWALQQRIEELERRLRDLGGTVPPAAYTASRAGTVPPMPPSVQLTEAQRTDGDAFAAVLHQSILREQMRSTAPAAMPAAPHPQQTMQPAMQVQPQARPVAPPPPVPQQTPVPAPREEDGMPEEEMQPAAQEDESMGKARALLRAGRTIEQVARETGVEIGALRLMKQMTQKD